MLVQTCCVTRSLSPLRILRPIPFTPSAAMAAPALFWRIGEHDEAGEHQFVLIGHRCPLTVGLEFAPGDAECAKSVRAELLENFRGAGPRRVVERQGLEAYRALRTGWRA